MKVRVGKTDMARADGKELSSCVRRAGGSCGGDRKGDCSQNVQAVHSQRCLHALCKA